MRRLPASQFSHITTLKGMTEEERAEFSYNNIRHYFRVLLYDRRPVCVYCGVAFKDTAEATLDHILPRSKGGRTRLLNLQLMHATCNGLKYDHMPKTWHPLATVPIKSHSGSGGKWPAKSSRKGV